MKIFSNIIFLTFLCFAHFKCAEGAGGFDLNAELGSDGEPRCAEPEHVQLSTQLTLRDLFPGYDGVHLPPLEAVQHPKFEEYAHIVYRLDYKKGPVPIEPNRFIVRRANVIIGVLGPQHNIKPVTPPYGQFNSVYDPENGWVQLKPAEIHQLGIDQRLGNMQIDDKTIAEDLPCIDHPEYARKAAHVEASHDASVQAAFQMYVQRSQSGEQKHPFNTEIMTEAYKQAYDKAYQAAFFRARNRAERFRDRKVLTGIRPECPQ